MTQPTPPPPIADPKSTGKVPVTAANQLRLTRTATPSPLFLRLYSVFVWISVLMAAAYLTSYLLDRFGIRDFKIEFNR
ncbi:hypothetical protein EON80_22365 [bacterium]|nr:MAG: hypothetical protein EON80_22365 [bacterium]